MMSICGCGRRTDLLACRRSRAALSLSLVRFSRRSAVGCVVGLRLLASLLAGFRHRLRCRVFSYSIPDEMMRITGSCDIRLSFRLSCRRTFRLSSLLA